VFSLMSEGPVVMAKQRGLVLSPGGDLGLPLADPLVFHEDWPTALCGRPMTAPDVPRTSGTRAPRSGLPIKAHSQKTQPDAAGCCIATS
jgi:hypothetical protein